MNGLGREIYLLARLSTTTFSPDGCPEVDDAPPEWGGLVLVGGFLVGLALCGCRDLIDIIVVPFGVNDCVIDAVLLKR